MELQDYVRVIRKRWRVVLVTTLLVLLVATGVTLAMPKIYESSARVFVSTGSGSDISELAAGSTFTQRQVKTYADVATTPRVLQPVIAQLQLPTTLEELAESVTTTVPVDTVLISIAVRDTDPGRSAVVAQAVAEQLTTSVPQLETVGRRASPVKLTIVANAAPGLQVSPQPARNVGLGLILGLLLGLGIALLRERLDTSIRTERDVTALTDLTIIGGIHHDPEADGTPLLIQADPHSARAEAFRALRTNLQFIDVSNPPQAFAVTSSIRGEGKTTVAANLALTIAASGARVCVIEGDLRRSRLTRYMGLETGVGLTSVLIGEASLDDVLQPFGETTLTVLAAGPVPPNPSELLGSSVMRGVLDELRRRFDYVVIDTPPMLPVTDAAVVSRLVDGALLVVGAGVVRREHLARAVDITEVVGVRVLGLVLNRLPVTGQDSYATYSYGSYGGFYTNLHPLDPQAKKRFWQRAARHAEPPVRAPLPSFSAATGAIASSARAAEGPRPASSTG